MDRAARRTDQKLAAMEKRLTQIYSRAHGEISEKWAAYVNSHQERAKPLYDAIQAATTPDEKKKAQADFSRYVNNVIRDNQRYQDLTAQFAANLTNVNKTAQAYINGQLPEIYAINYNEIGSQIKKQVKGYSFDVVNQDVVKRLATENKTLLPYKTVDEKKTIRWNTKKVNAEVTQGIIQGDSIPDIAKNQVEHQEGERRSNARHYTGRQHPGHCEAFKERYRNESCVVCTKCKNYNDKRTEQRPDRQLPCGRGKGSDTQEGMACHKRHPDT